MLGCGHSRAGPRSHQVWTILQLLPCGQGCRWQGYNNPAWLLLKGEGSGRVLFPIFCGGGNGLREVQGVSLAHLARRWGSSKFKSECSDSQVLTSLFLILHSSKPRGLHLFVVGELPLGEPVYQISKLLMCSFPQANSIYKSPAHKHQHYT